MFYRLFRIPSTASNAIMVLKIKLILIVYTHGRTYDFYSLNEEKAEPIQVKITHPYRKFLPPQTTSAHDHFTKCYNRCMNFPSHLPGCKKKNILIILFYPTTCIFMSSCLQIHCPHNFRVNWVLFFQWRTWSISISLFSFFSLLFFICYLFYLTKSKQDNQIQKNLISINALSIINRQKKKKNIHHQMQYNIINCWCSTTLIIVHNMINITNFFFFLNGIINITINATT